MKYKVVYDCYRFTQWWRCADTIDLDWTYPNYRLKLLEIVSKKEMTTCKNLSFNISYHNKQNLKWTE